VSESRLVTRRPPHPTFQATFSPRGEGFDRASFGGLRFVPRDPECFNGLFPPGMESRAGLAAPIDPSPPRGEGFDRASFGGLRFVPHDPERFNGLFAPGMESRAGLAAPIDPSPPWGEGGLEGRMRGTAR
jgi:hypothetical protein